MIGPYLPPPIIIAHGDPGPGPDIRSLLLILVPAVLLAGLFLLAYVLRFRPTRTSVTLAHCLLCHEHFVTMSIYGNGYVKCPYCGRKYKLDRSSRQQ